MGVLLLLHCCLSCSICSLGSAYIALHLMRSEIVKRISKVRALLTENKVRNIKETFFTGAVGAPGIKFKYRP